jgi:hypothetical protein
LYLSNNYEREKGGPYRRKIVGIEVIELSSIITIKLNYEVNYFAFFHEIANRAPIRKRFCDHSRNFA